MDLAVCNLYHHKPNTTLAQKQITILFTRSNKSIPAHVAWTFLVDLLNR